MIFLFILSPPPLIPSPSRSPNIFLSSLNPEAPVVAKVADFGLSTFVSHKVGGALKTWNWLPPEALCAVGEEVGFLKLFYFILFCFRFCYLFVNFSSSREEMSNMMNNLMFIPLELSCGKLLQENILLKRIMPNGIIIFLQIYHPTP